MPYRFFLGPLRLQQINPVAYKLKLSDSSTIFHISQLRRKEVLATW
jgi:hypothetical protein